MKNPTTFFQGTFTLLIAVDTYGFGGQSDCCMFSSMSAWRKKNEYDKDNIQLSLIIISREEAWGKAIPTVLILALMQCLTMYFSCFFEVVLVNTCMYLSICTHSFCKPCSPKNNSQALRRKKIKLPLSLRTWNNSTSLFSPLGGLSEWKHGIGVEHLFSGVLMLASNAALKFSNK